MKMNGDWIFHPGTQAFCAALEARGHQALFVGGCVRNALMGVPVADIDMSTDAVPEVVTEIAQAAGFKVIPTGIDHGTVTVIAQSCVHEITTFRRDVETNGRHAVVAYSTDIKDDAARRDFTMNALYADRRGHVIDPLGGLPDLQARHLRFVGEPEARIREDYLRILRFFRFYAHYGDPDHGIDAEGLAACADNAEGIAGLSKERVGAEMRKLLSAKDPAPAVASMAATGVLMQVLPGADAKALAPLVHLDQDLPLRWLRRLAVLGGEDLAENLRLSRAEARDLARVKEEIGTLRPPAALAWLLGADLAGDVMLARAALFEMPLPMGWQDQVARGQAAICPVSAKELMPALQGAALGQRLKQIEAAWLASDLTLDRAALLA